MDIPPEEVNVEKDNTHDTCPAKDKEKPVSRLFSIFSGIKRISSEHTLQLVSTHDPLVEKHFAYGVDFGTTAIKLAQIGIFEKKPQIVDIIIEELPPDLFTNSLQRNKAVEDTFKKIVAKHKIKGSVVTALSSAQVEIKRLELPPMPEDEISAAVKWELKQTSSSGLEDLCFDYYVLDKNKSDSSPGKDVMVITCPKKEVLEQLKIIKAANLIPLAIEVDCLASVFSCRYTEQIKKEEIVLFLEFGCSSCNINIIMNRQVCFKRDLTINGNFLTQSIAKQCSISYDRAEELKKKFGLIPMDSLENAALDYGDSDKILVNQTLWLHMEDLIQEIIYTFKFFTHQFIGSEISKFDRIILSGGAGNLNHFSSYLSKYLSVPVEIIDVLDKIEILPEVRSKFDNLQLLSPRLSVAVGLALRELSLCSA